MATLNTLRTRFGVVLSAVIAIALLAFVFSLSSEMGFSGKEPIVAQIDGESITYTDYERVYNTLLTQSGVTDLTEEQSEQLYAATWQALISQVALEPGFEKLGLDVSEEERMAIIRGEVPTQALYSAFADPSTGQYSLNALNNFLFTSNGNPQAEALWTSLMEQAITERVMMKYLGLVRGGVNVNSLEIEEGLLAMNKSFSGRWVSKSYSDVDDSQVEGVTSAEVKSYYEENKASYKRQPTRSISYVEFNIDPSQEDRSEAESRARSLASELSTTSDIRKFLRESRSGSIAETYVPASSLPAAEAKALVAGEMYGPQLVAGKWVASRVESKLMAPEKVSVRHIVLPYTSDKLADSLLVALRKGTEIDFAVAATAYSVFSESASEGGEVGEIPFSEFSSEFATAIAPLRVGDIVKVESGDMIQLIQVYKMGSRVNHYRVASIDVPVVASQSTRTAAHNAAGLFAVEAKGGAAKFEAAVKEASLSSHKADLTSATRSISAVVGSTEVARWAHRAQVGELSQIFKVGDGYLVAMLTSVNDTSYRAVEEVTPTIERQLIRDKKFALLSSQIKGESLEEIGESLDAKSGEFEDANYGLYYINGIGVEPRVIGSITTTEREGVVSAPVKGNSALYVYVVDSITESDEPQGFDAERVRAEAAMVQLVQQSLFSALESLAEVKDMRGATL